MRWPKISSIVCVVLVGLSPVLGLAQPPVSNRRNQSPPRYNVIVILLDHQRYDAMGLVGIR
jgi:hypothetical protein